MNVRALPVSYFSFNSMYINISHRNCNNSKLALGDGIIQQNHSIRCKKIKRKLQQKNKNKFRSTLFMKVTPTRVLVVSKLHKLSILLTVNL